MSNIQPRADTFAHSSNSSSSSEGNDPRDNIVLAAAAAAAGSFSGSPDERREECIYARGEKRQITGRRREESPMDKGRVKKEPRRERERGRKISRVCVCASFALKSFRRIEYIFSDRILILCVRE